jgi:two-component sensor histidine kinase
MNAVKHVFPNGSGTIEVTLSRPTAGYVLLVQDDGIGMKGRPRDEDGLGMQIARRLAAQLGGNLKFDDVATGTRVRVAFPEAVTRSPEVEAVGQPDRRRPAHTSG